MPLFLSQITQPPLLNHSSSHPLSTQLSLSLSQNSLKLSSSRRHSRPSRPKAPNHSPSLLSHRHALNLLHSPPAARPSRPKSLINSPSFSSLTVTFRCSVIGNQSVGDDVDSVGSIDAWVCLQFVLGLSPVGDFVWYGLRIWVFFSLLWTATTGGDDGGGGGGGCLCCVVVVVIYYFIVVEILFYCDDYIILLC